MKANYPINQQINKIDMEEGGLKDIVIGTLIITFTILMYGLIIFCITNHNK